MKPDCFYSLVRYASVTIKNFLFIRNRFYRLLSLIVVSFLFSFLCNATKYYVSSSIGNDVNSGTSPASPWKSLAKVNSFSPLPGDEILFRRGDEWNGTITVNASGTAGNPIVYGAYGEGAKPKIYGSEVITGWQLHEGNIWKATVTNPVTQLFLNGAKMKVARLQNTGYSTITSVQSSTQFTSTEIPSKADGYYTGCKWFGRTNDWRAVTRTVSASSGNTITLDASETYNYNVGEGFILMGKLEFLDSSGEWCFDNAANTVYFRTPEGDTPNNYIVRGSIIDNGVFLNSGRDYIMVRDLEILEQTRYGIYFPGGNENIVINNNTLKNQDQFGLYIYNTQGTIARYCSITNNYVNGQNQRGIYAIIADSDVSDNTVENIGLLENIGLNGSGNAITGTLFGVGIDVYGNSPGSENTIRYNRISNTGYSGLYFRGKSYIEYNFITRSCLVTQDGGGIYTPSPTSYNSLLNSNIVLYAIGNADGVTSTERKAHGIYMDDPTGNIILENNTVAYCNGGGLFLHHNGKTEVRYNTSFGNRNGLLASREWDVNSFHHNIVYALNIADEAEENQLLSRVHNGADSVVFDNNTYVHHYNSSKTFRRTSMPEYAYYDFAGWKTATGQDANSTIDSSPMISGETEQLFYNDTKQTKTFELENFIYKDIYGEKVIGTITLAPFTSKILIKTTFVPGENHVPKIQNQSFDILGVKQKNEFVGVVTATDSDPDQSLSYSILQGNNEALFTINPSTGEIRTNAILNMTKDTTIVLVVRVTDNGTDPLSATANVSIKFFTGSTTFSEYLFEETSGDIVKDSNGSNDGIIHNETLRIEGIKGMGLSFTGSGYINLGECFGVNVLNEFTLSVWLKPAGTTGGNQGIIMHGGPNTDTYALYIKPDTKEIGFKTTGTTNSWFSIKNVTALWDGNWHHLALIYDGAMKVIYLDNNVVASIDATGNIDSGSGYNLLIGAGRDIAIPTLVYKGAIDEVRIYNYALTPSGIRALYDLATLSIDIASSNPVNNIEIFPNPAKNKVSIRFLSLPKGEVELVLLDATGRPLIKRKVQNNPEIFNLDNLPNGFYFILINDKYSTYQSKIIKCD
jgi:parallel beta-helix repeat protein